MGDVDINTNNTMEEGGGGGGTVKPLLSVAYLLKTLCHLMSVKICTAKHSIVQVWFPAGHTGDPFPF